MSTAPLIRLDGAGRASRDSWTYHPPAARLLLRCDGGTHLSQLRSADGVQREWRDPLAALAWMEKHARERNPADARWVGFLSYELGRLFENLPSRKIDDLNAPLFAFTFHAEDPTCRPLAAKTCDVRAELPLRSNFTRDEYLSAVRRALAYIGAGDVFQVNLSQRFSVGLREPAEVVYERLRQRSPAAYGGYLDFGSIALLCNSPELFLRVTPDRRVVTRPIKGTRPHGPGMEQALRNSGKDEAELNMIVDLERNDLGRVCITGSVRVTEARAIEAHPTVYHGAATIEGEVRDDVSFVDLLRATFPGGSVTGAPKIRAMQIIDELEPTRRGPYCGAIGYLSGDGTMEFNVAIRTTIVRDGIAHIPVGGGIVADSDPAAEYEETLVKARAIFEALRISTEQVSRL